MGGVGSIPGQGAGFPHGLPAEKPKGQTEAICNKLKKDFKNGPHQKKVLKNKTVHSMAHMGHMQYCHDIYYLINNFFQ